MRAYELDTGKSDLRGIRSGPGSRSPIVPTEKSNFDFIILMNNRDTTLKI